MSGPSTALVSVRDTPLTLDEVLGAWPVIRQSWAGRFDDCEMMSLFEIGGAQHYSTHPQSAGTMFHRFAAECLRTMREQQMDRIPVGIALAILEECLLQRDVAPEEIVRVPLREMPRMRMAARKFATDNAFTVANIVDIEKRLYADLEGVPWYAGHETYTRRLTGQIDALIARPPDEAVVIDWKYSWQLPPQHDEDDENPGLSYNGYFQQRWYAWLIFRNYPSINAVALREFYPLRTKARAARITRDKMPEIEDQLRTLIANMDRALSVGAPPEIELEVIDRHGSWKPSPGKHCGYCIASQDCPIDGMWRDDGGIESMEDAQRFAAVRTVAKSIHKHVDRKLKTFADVHGPIEIASSKGRRMLGYRLLSNGQTRWDEYTPTGMDRPADEEVYDPNQDGVDDTGVT